MSAYRQLLDATIAHLEHLEEIGVDTVPVQAETLKRLGAPMAARTSPARNPTTSVPSSRPATAGASGRPAAAQVPPPPTSPPSLPKPMEIRSLPGAVGTAGPILRPMAGPPLPPKLPPAEKTVAFAALREKVLVCEQCPQLVVRRHSVVFGVGDPDARLMFVGEAPGAEEDRAGEPFVGAAGALLTKIITAMGLSREQVYIANVLKCRPDMPAGVPGNRKPKPEEMATCIPWLQEQVDLIQPEVVVALGGTAVEGLIGGTVFITRMRGDWLNYRGIPLMPTFHPSYLLRATTQGEAEKRKVWEDMLAVMERLQLPISARQRGFFRKA